MVLRHGSTRFANRLLYFCVSPKLTDATAADGTHAYCFFFTRIESKVCVTW